MNRWISSSYGFTIIEVMLFLAVSSLLTIGLLGSWSLAVNTQSYKDSLRSLSSKLQQQYTNVLDVANSRDGNYSCTRATSHGVSYVNVVPSEGSGAISRGASDCFVLGRYILAKGSQFTISPILGFADTDSIDEGDELTVIKSYSPTRIAGVEGLKDETYTIPWSTKTYAAGGNKSTSLIFAMAIIRSPVSGSMSTYVKKFAADAQPPSVATMLDDPTSRNKFTICLDPGAPVAMGSTAIVIDKNASGQSSIEQVGDGTGSTC